MELLQGPGTFFFPWPRPAKEQEEERRNRSLPRPEGREELAGTHHKSILEDVPNQMPKGHLGAQALQGVF